jgi:hypothetical protein
MNIIHRQTMSTITPARLEEYIEQSKNDPITLHGNMMAFITQMRTQVDFQIAVRNKLQIAVAD